MVSRVLSTDIDISSRHFAAIGKAVFTWSQVENSLKAILISAGHGMWLDNVAAVAANHKKDLVSGSARFQFDKIVSELRGRVSHDPISKDLLDATDALYEQRNDFFHGMWGVQTSTLGKSLGLYTWSRREINNFREVPLSELDNFAQKCIELRKALIKHLSPALHGPGVGLTVESDGSIHLTR